MSTIIFPFMGAGGGGSGGSVAIQWAGWNNPAASTSSITLDTTLYETVSPFNLTSSLTNDIFLSVIETQDGETITAPSGWAAVTGAPVTSSGIDGTKCHLFWKRVASDGEVPTFTASDPGDHWIGTTYMFRNVKASGNPWNVATTGSGSGSSSFSMSTVTTTVNNCYVCYFATQGEDGGGPYFSSWTNSNLTSLTERDEHYTSLSNGGGLVLASGVMATAGAVGATTVNCATPNNIAYVVLALEPAFP